MVQTQLINTTIDWERRLTYNEEKRKYNRREPYRNYLAPLQPSEPAEKACEQGRSPVDFVRALILSL